MILSIFYYVNCDYKTSSYIAVVPLKSYLPIDYSIRGEINQLISSWNFRKIYLNPEVESGQQIPMFLNFEQSNIHTSEMIAYFRDDEEKYRKQYTQNCSQICKYNYEISNSYTNLSYFFNKDFFSLRAHSASEKMIFYRDLASKEKSIYEVKFLHTYNATHITNHICLLTGILDTNSESDKRHYLFYQVKNLIHSKKFTWSLYFTGPNEGKFIIGDIIDNKDLTFYNDNKNENYFGVRQLNLTNKIFWRLSSEKIYIGNYVNNNKNTYIIAIHNRYISVKSDLFEDIKKQYLLDIAIEKSICTETTTDSYYRSIYCNKKAFLSLTDNYNKLHDFILSLSLEDSKENITFSPKDLFLEKDDNIYFFIRDDKKINEYGYFSIGSLLLEKYITVFDDESKYLYILKQKVKPGEKQKDYTTFKIVLIALLSFILCTIIFVVIGKLFGKKLFGTRKIKANELADDDFDYSPESINNEKKNNDGLLDDYEENGGNGGNSGK